MYYLGMIGNLIGLLYGAICFLVIPGIVVFFYIANCYRRSQERKKKKDQLYPDEDMYLHEHFSNGPLDR